MTVKSCDGAADAKTTSEASKYIQAEKLLLAHAQLDSFSEEFRALKQAFPSDSSLSSLAPEFDKDAGFLEVGGCLHHAETLPFDTVR